MKNFIIAIMMFGNIHSQTPDFIFWDERQDINEFIKSMTFGNEALYASSHSYKIEPVHNYLTILTKIRKFDSNFQLLDSVILTKDSFVVDINCIKYLNGSLYGFGNIRSKFDPDLFALYVLKLDSDLRIIKDTMIEVPYTYSPWFVKGKIWSDSGFVISTPFSYWRTAAFVHFNFFAILDTNLTLDVSNLMDIQAGNLAEVYELIPEIGDTTFFAASWKSFRLDRNLEVIKIFDRMDKNIIDFYCGGNQETIGKFTDSSYLACQTSCDYIDIELFKCDIDFKIHRKIVFGSTQNDVAAINQTLDWHHTSQIYAGGFTYNISNTRPNSVILANFNDKLDMRWVKYFGSDRNYLINHILASPDGGCLVAGLRNSSLNSYDADPIILKIDSTGSITSTYSPLGGEKFWSVKVNPNPVSDYLKMEFENVKGEVLITLLNADGISMMEDNYNHLDGTINLNLSDLPSGIYLYDVIHQNRRIAQGKVVKE